MQRLCTPSTHHFHLALIVLIAVLPGSSAGQDAPRHREFSAYVLQREATQNSGFGVRVNVKDANAYVNLVDGKGRHVPFWFRSNGVIASAKEYPALAQEWEDAGSGPSVNWFAVGLMLPFHPAHPDRFCEELRSYTIEVLKAFDEGSHEAWSLEEFPCEYTGRETVAGRNCPTYRVPGDFVTMGENRATVSFDPQLATILQVHISPPAGVILRLDAIKEGPQPDSLFVLPPDHVVIAGPKKLKAKSPNAH